MNNQIQKFSAEIYENNFTSRHFSDIRMNSERYAICSLFYTYV